MYKRYNCRCMCILGRIFISAGYDLATFVLNLNNSFYMTYKTWQFYNIAQRRTNYEILHLD